MIALRGVTPLHPSTIVKRSGLGVGALSQPSDEVPLEPVSHCPMGADWVACSLLHTAVEISLQRCPLPLPLPLAG
jgi:hypothetical protein